MKKSYFYFLGVITGLANGIFGSGGGMLAVPLLEKAELEPKKAHATSISLTLPLSIISAFLYFKSGNLDIKNAFKYVPAGLLGAILGGFFLKKLNNIYLKKIFAVMLMISGLRMLIK